MCDLCRLVGEDAEIGINIECSLFDSKKHGETVSLTLAISTNDEPKFEGNTLCLKRDTFNEFVSTDFGKRALLGLFSGDMLNVYTDTGDGMTLLLAQLGVHIIAHIDDIRDMLVTTETQPITNITDETGIWYDSELQEILMVSSTLDNLILSGNASIEANLDLDGLSPTIH